MGRTRRSEVLREGNPINEEASANYMQSLPLISMTVGGRGVATTPAAARLCPPLIPIAVEVMVVDVAAGWMLLLYGIAAAANVVVVGGGFA